MLACSTRGRTVGRSNSDPAGAVMMTINEFEAMALELARL